MADVLALLRSYHISGRPIVETPTEIVFGDFAWPKSTKTNFLVWGSGKDSNTKDYYSLDCIVYLLKHIDLPHTQYVRQAAGAGVPVVRLPDRKDLLAYLKGETSSAANLDRAAPVDISLRRPVSKRQSTDLIAHLRRDAANESGLVDTDTDSKRTRLIVASSDRLLDDTAVSANLSNVSADEESTAREKRLLSAKLETSFTNRSSALIPPEQVKTSSLPDSIPLDKIQSWRAKFRAIQQQRIKSDDIDNVLETSMISGHVPTNATSIVGLHRTDRLHTTTLGGEQQMIVRIDDTALHTPFQSSVTTDSSIPKAALVADEAAVRPIAARERRWRTRVTVLQSQGKMFYENIVLGILRNVIMKEDSGGVDQRMPNKLGATGTHYSSGFPQPLAVGASYVKPAPGATHFTNTGSAMAISTGQPGMSVGNSAHHPQMHYSRYDQERFASGREETAGFRIDTMATYHGKALGSVVTGGGSGDGPNNAEGTTKSRSAATPRQDYPVKRDPRGPVSGTPATPSATPDPYRSSLRSIADARLAARTKARSSRIPIIVIPAAPTSLITMYNARDILQELSFVKSQDNQSAGVRRENEILIHRKKPDGRSVPYRVVDQPLKLQPDEWNRVVAIFVQGQAWQFKGWPMGSDPAIIFSLVKGFHLKYTNMPLDANVAKWNVRVINLDQRRHLDKANFQQIWDQLDKHIAKCKPFLRA